MHDCETDLLAKGYSKHLVVQLINCLQIMLFFMGIDTLYSLKPFVTLFLIASLLWQLSHQRTVPRRTLTTKLQQRQCKIV